MTTSPIADEAARLFAALQDWIEGHAGAAPIATGSPECCVCPICQLLTVSRTIRPDILEHLSSAALELIAALRSAVDTPAETGDRSRPDVEHIDIRE